MTFLQNLMLVTLAGFFALVGTLLGYYLNERSIERERAAVQCREEIEFVKDNPELSNLSYDFFSCSTSRAVYLKSLIKKPDIIIDEVADRVRALAVSRRDEVITRLSSCSDVECDRLQNKIRKLADERKALLGELQSVGLQLQTAESARDQQVLRLNDNAFVCGTHCAELDEKLVVLHSERRAIEAHLKRDSELLAEAILEAERHLK
ncbi:MAG: hypothetical protein ACU0GG_21825 [Paracoccaceae bacterium]